MPNADTPIACTLAPGSFAARLVQIGALFRRALKSSRRDGQKLRLSFAADARDDVTKLVELERACCAFLDFELQSAADSVELTITVPDGNSADDLLAPFLESRP